MGAAKTGASGPVPRLPGKSSFLYGALYAHSRTASPLCGCTWTGQKCLCTSRNRASNSFDWKSSTSSENTKQTATLTLIKSNCLEQSYLYIQNTGKCTLCRQFQIFIGKIANDGAKNHHEERKQINRYINVQKRNQSGWCSHQKSMQQIRWIRAIARVDQ